MTASGGHWYETMIRILTEFHLSNDVRCVVADQTCALHGKSSKAGEKIQKMVFSK